MAGEVGVLPRVLRTGFAPSLIAASRSFADEHVQLAYGLANKHECAWSARPGTDYAHNHDQLLTDVVSLAKLARIPVECTVSSCFEADCEPRSNP